eukprot:gene5330-12924_t
MAHSQMGLVGLAVMGQNLALNVASKGFSISVFNRSYNKTEAAVKRAEKEGLSNKLRGFEEMKDFVESLEKPRRVMILVKAGAPVDSTIKLLMQYLEPDDIIIDGGNEWYENTEKRLAMVAEKGLRYLGMGVSGGEEGARNGTAEAYQFIQPIMEKVCAQVDTGPCVMYVGAGGAGNFVKMVHNGIEYGDMQLISEAYDILKTLGGLTNEELAAVFHEWNKGDLQSFLIEISAIILNKKDDKADGYILDKVVDKTGSKGTASLDARYMSALKDERVVAHKIFADLGVKDPALQPGVDKATLIHDVAQALYASKICSYAQGMNIIKAKSEEKSWGVNLGKLASIWKGGCIIRAKFLDDISKAYDTDANLANLLIDPNFALRLVERESAWRRVVGLAVANGIPAPGFATSLGYFDTYRRDRLPANLVQAQRDFFGSHTYQRSDAKGWFHTVWDASFGSADSITTSHYNT